MKRLDSDLGLHMHCPAGLAAYGLAEGGVLSDYELTWGYCLGQSSITMFTTIPGLLFSTVF